MIRDYKVEDKDELIKIIRQGIVIDEQDIFEYFNDDDIKIIVYDDSEEGIQGFSCVKLWNDTEKKADVLLYVIPDARRKGIGTLLYNEIMKQEAGVKLTFIKTRFRVDKDDATFFYKGLGYKKWYGMHDLYYNGSVQPKSDLQFVAYEDKYFEQYAEGLRKSFYEMRKVHDFQPHLCCELNNKKREEFLENKEQIFLLINNETLIASAIVNNSGFLDDIFVIPSYQGKGYGRLITQFAINNAISKGFNKIETSVVEWNARALKLYQSLGFSKIQTTHYYQLVKDEI
ncbi:GNAT family N-acetyltransferase [Clostridium sp. FP2]|uniref:GNAT family N-acetyltransferase n=1 Tax=Clostridium sp. FP2 TaxID=2724481 RepID=UPI0013E93611|nr:GNAT family N-acetyltransferase [Clostridium sp. FP2]MBZ9626222.1 GNAT family N-acetyltransferase [Clostridium sp. FP2]